MDELANTLTIWKWGVPLNGDFNGDDDDQTMDSCAKSCMHMSLIVQCFILWWYSWSMCLYLHLLYIQIWRIYLGMYIIYDCICTVYSNIQYMYTDCNSRFGVRQAHHNIARSPRAARLECTTLAQTFSPSGDVKTEPVFCGMKVSRCQSQHHYHHSK